MHRIDIVAWNESDPTIADSGLVSRTKGDDVALRAFLFAFGEMEFWDGQGRYNEDGIKFQISKKELDDKGFSIKAGKTHVEYSGKIWKVMSLMDYTMFKHTQLLQAKAMKIIDVD